MQIHHFVGLRLCQYFSYRLQMNIIKQAASSQSSTIEILAMSLTNATEAFSVFSGVIEKPGNDKREYRHITLGNELKCLLVSDPTTEKSAACCDVNVGSMSDPPEAQGLAHFLEHMLFMGTEKYPEENAYSAYLNAHGGGSNAYTDDENTVYYFDVQSDYMEGALDMFAGFFTDPLFAESSTAREMNAVDSEHSKNLQSDTWRKNQLFKQMAREDHPISHFSTGDLQTLSKVPESKGLNVRDLMISFYKKHYSANLMRVCVYARAPLDEIQGWVVEKFSRVPNYNLAKNVFPSDPFRSSETGRRLDIVPIK